MFVAALYREVFPVRKDVMKFLYCMLPIVVLVAGCLATSENEIVVFVALDKEFSQPILKELEQELDVRILAKFDQESNKTVGLVTELIQNQNRPRADVFWNNEILHTFRLQKLGLLTAYHSQAADNFPPTFVSDQNMWHGFAARGRVLIVNTELIPAAADYPRSVYDLANPKWKRQCAMAKPLFGTSATHAAVLFDYLGATAGEKLLTEIAANAAIESGNKSVAIKVARGEYAFGLTDTDDAIIEIEGAQPVAIVFPDQGDDQMGALLIPNTLCIIKNGPHPEAAKRLVDRLLQADVEMRLAAGPSAQIPLNKTITVGSRVQPVGPAELKILIANFKSAAGQWDKTSQSLIRIFSNSQP